MIRRWSATLVLLLLASSVHAQAVAGRYTGSFRTVNNTFSSMGASSRGSSSASTTTRYSGTFELTPSVTQPAGFWHVELHITGGRSAESLEWGVSTGRCGGTLMLLQVGATLAPVEVRSGGNGDLTDEVKFELSKDESYQVVLFRGGRSQQNAVACANLRFSDKK